jgi:hypothetical protein
MSCLSLESIHSYIHSWTGGFEAYIGHMAEVSVATFDPDILDAPLVSFPLCNGI